jgi:hypothetical protein
MKSLAMAITLNLAVLSALAHAQSPKGALTLFDGKTLDSWVAEGAKDTVVDGKPQPVWTVRDGMIVCNGKGFGFLRYAAKEFGDFTFHVEYRIAKNGNSGIGIRTVPFDPKQSIATRPSYACYEIQLVDDAGKPASTHSTGSLYRYVAPGSNPAKPAGEWNSMDIDCTGPHIRIHLNGVKIIDVDQRTIAAIKDKPLRGYVCLQNHGRNIEFRNLWLREGK